MPEAVAVVPRNDRRRENGGREAKTGRPSPPTQSRDYRGSAKASASAELVILWQPWVCFLKTHCLESLTLLSVCSSFPVEAVDCGSTKPLQVCCWVPEEPHPLQARAAANFQAMGISFSFLQKTELRDHATHSSPLYPGSWSSHPLYWLVSFMST